MAQKSLKEEGFTPIDLSGLDNMLLSPPVDKDRQVIADYIKQHEGVSTTPYKDTSGNLTTGIGHLGPSNLPPEEQFNKDLDAKIALTQSLFPKYPEYPLDVKKALVDGVFRGEHKKGNKTTTLINEGKWDQVPKEYLNREDYRRSKNPANKQTGVAKRMDENASIFKKHGDSKRRSLNPLAITEAQAAEGDFDLDSMLNGPTPHDEVDGLLLGQPVSRVIPTLQEPVATEQKPPVDNLGTSLLKGAASGTEQAIGQTLGSPLVASGEKAQFDASKELAKDNKGWKFQLGRETYNKALLNAGKGIEDLGTKIRDYFVQNSLKGWEAPDQKAMQAKFGEVGYGRRLSYSLGSSVPMMTAAIGVTAATKNPFMGAAIFGPQAFGSFYDTARENGVGVDDSIGLAVVNSVSQVGLEVIPIAGWLKKGGGLLKRIARGALQEGLIEEGSQQIVQNALEGIGWKGKDTNLLDGVLESVIVGSMMGAGMGVVPSSKTIEDIKFDAKKRVTKSLVADAMKQGISSEALAPVIEEASKAIDAIDPDKLEAISHKVTGEVTQEAIPEVNSVLSHSTPTSQSYVPSEAPGSSIVENKGIVQAPASDKHPLEGAPVFHGTVTPGVPLSLNTMDSDLGVHFGNKGAAQTRLRFKENGVIQNYELTNVKKVLEVKDTGTNWGDPGPVLEMLEESGGLTPEQIDHLSYIVIPKKLGTDARLNAQDKWLKQANKFLVQNGYTHLSYNNTAEGGRSFVALTNEGFKVREAVHPVKEDEKFVQTIKQAPYKAPKGTTSFNDLVSKGTITKEQVIEGLKNQARGQWKKTKGVSVVQGEVNFDNIMDMVVAQAYPHLVNRNWNPTHVDGTAYPVETWLDSACSSAVGEAIQELSVETGKAQDRRDDAALRKFMDEAEFSDNPKEYTLEELKALKIRVNSKYNLEGKRLENSFERTKGKDSFDALKEANIEPAAPEPPSEFHSGPSFKVEFPTITQIMANIKDALGHTKESWAKVINPLRYFPELKNFPRLLNALRVELIGAPQATRTWIDKVYLSIWSGLDINQQQVSIDLLKAKSQLERIKLGRISATTEAEVTADIERLLKIAGPKSLEAADKWNRLEKAVRDDLVKRGLLDPEQLMEDHVMFLVDEKYQSWHLWSSTPRRLKRPVQGYLKEAKGTLKSYRVDMDTLLGSMYRIKLDNTLVDFANKWLTKYDIVNQMTPEEQMAFFGSKVIFGTTLVPKSPLPNKTYEIDGKKYTGYQFEPFKNQMFKTEEGQLALGKLNKVYLVPSEIVPVFNNLKPQYDQFMGPVMYNINRATSFFKSTAIFSVWAKYNINNLVGDAYTLYMQSPKSFLYFDKAIKFLSKPQKFYTPQERALWEFIDRQKVFATFNEAEAFHFKHNPLNLIETANRISGWREKILRACIAMRLFENLQKGKNLAPAFDWINTKGLSPEEAIGKVAREVMIDYEATSAHFNKYVKGGVAPFATWYTKIFSTFTRLMKNHPFKTLAAMMIPAIILNMWNNKDDKNKEIEENLPEYIRNKTHIVLGKSKKPGYAWVHVAQLPVDAVPVFPMVTIGTKNGFEYMQGKKSLKDALIDSVSGTFKSSWRQINFLATPFKRFAEGIWSNKDPITQQQIVPREGKVTFAKAKEKQAIFFFNTFVPPISLAIRSGKDLEYSGDDTWATAGMRWGKQWINWMSSLGFQEVSLTGKEEKVEAAADKWTRKYNDILVTYADDFAANKHKNSDYYVNLAIKDGLVRTEADKIALISDFLNIQNNPKWAQLNLQEKLKYTQDTQRRESMQRGIDFARKAKYEERIKTVPKGARSATLRELFPSN